MGMPVKNDRVEFEGIVFYRDSVDLDIWHYGPYRGSWDFTRREIGGRRTIWNAVRDFQPDTSLLQRFAEVRRAKATIPLALGAASKYSIALESAIETPHVSKLQINPSLPIPSLTFSATLINDEPNYTSLDERIRRGLEADRLLLGEISWIFGALNVALRGRIVIDLRATLSALIGRIGRPEVWYPELVVALMSLIDDEFTSIVRVEYGRLSNEQTNFLKAYLIDLALNRLTSHSVSHSEFDQNYTVDSRVLRVPAELNWEPIKEPLSISSPTQEEYVLKFTNE